MSKYLPRILIGVVVGVVLAFLMSMINGWDNQSVLTGVFGGVATAYILSNLAGNRKVDVASADDRGKALQLTPPPGKALVVVYREGFVAKLAGMNMAIDGTEVAQLKAPRFTLIAVPPGAHTLTTAFGGLAGAQSKGGSYEFSAPEGGVVAIRIGVRMGMVQGAFDYSQQADLAQVRNKLAGMPLVLATPAEL
jgi:hypothetical protein